jgi:hypothetical protein
MSVASPPELTSTILSSSLQSHTNLRTLSVFSDLAELTDFYHLILDSLLHPISALNTNLPHLNPCNMFWGKSFIPATDIPDLRGKVILVTGGQAAFFCGCISAR